MMGLLTFGEPPVDVVYEPEADQHGQLRLEEGESVLYQGSHRVVLNVRVKQHVNSDAYVWRQTVKPERKASVCFTDQRLLLAWPNWRSDRTSGSILERRVLSVFAERDHGQMVLGAHLRHPWVTAVYVGKTQGSFRLRRKVKVDFSQADQQSAFEIFGLEPDAAKGLGPSFTTAVARQRLEAHPRPTGAQTLKLEELIVPDLVPVDVGWADQYIIPAAKKVGRSF